MTDSAGGIGVLRKVLGIPSGYHEGGRASQDREWKVQGEFESRLIEALDRFKLIATLDEMWHAGVGRGLIVHDVADEREIGDYYREWLVKAEEVAGEIEIHRVSGLVFSLESEFLTCLEDARGICAPDEGFFAGPGIEVMRDLAVESYLTGETVELEDLRD